MVECALTKFVATVQGSSPADLVFDDETTVEASVAGIVNDNPGVDARRFRRYLQDRVQIVHGIASFLLAHLEFAGDGLAERAVHFARKGSPTSLVDNSLTGCFTSASGRFCCNSRRHLSKAQQSNPKGAPLESILRHPLLS